ncbi:MAG TPA: lasso peptide isopeptide bond-forming cyclase [Bryobacteraceae bacterium]|nr:lasso peptide isopeptide bond-forming cyclase [Bryobacteraceae bacterium]
MSGIAGLYYRQERPVETEALQAMLHAIRHRGPDGSGVWRDGSVGFGHCALHITPESLCERLPAATAESDLAITADARIDNRAELLGDLEVRAQSGAVTDSDLILAAYRKWGEACVDRLIGDFAFAIWDRRRRTIFCACDPMGVKSLYYFESAQLFAFASEIKALLALPEVPRKLNELRVAEYLVTLFEDRSGTFYDGIRRLPGACVMTVTPERCAVRQYWALDPKRELRLGSGDEYVEAFRDLFTEAVRCRTRSAFPIGAALSGGLDSSSIACLASRTRAPLHTFSLIFPDLPAEDRRVIDERAQIQAVLDGGGFEPHFIEADRLSPMGQIDRIHFHLDHANYAPNLYLHWAMYGAARDRGVRVFLDGFDGDSTVSHGFERLTELAQTLRWREAWREARLLSRNQLQGIPPPRIVKEFCIKPLTPRWAYLGWQFVRGRYRRVTGNKILISEKLKRRTDIERRARTLLRSQTAWSLRRTARQIHWQGLNQALYAYSLEIADKATAAFGVEARYPFFDRRVMEFCLALPADQKLGEGWNRWILRRAMQEVLPPQIQWRRSKGNLSPNFHRRLLDFERENLERVILKDPAAIAPFVDCDAMQGAYREYQKDHVRTRGESIQLFAAVNLALWLRSAGFSS